MRLATSLGGLLPLLLLVADSPRLGLHLPHLPQVEPDGSSTEGVSLRLPAVLLVGRSEAADERVKAAPGLPEWAGTRCRRVGVAEEGAHLGVDLRLAELVQVS